jgi:uridine kinase
MARKPFLIGIGGGTGAGKTTLARALRERYAGVGVSIVEQDSYYQDRSDLSETERKVLNYDQPSAIDHELLFGHLERLVSGIAIEKPRYCFARHTRSPEAERISPTPLIILEGLFALWDSRIRSLMGLKIYVDADPDLRFIRRLRRDVLERGRTVESVIAQYLESVRPMHHIYIGPTKAHADLVLDTSAARLGQLVASVDRALAERGQRLPVAKVD